jgi:hypothetical protein
MWLPPEINKKSRLNSSQIDNCTQFSNIFEIDGIEFSIKLDIGSYEPKSR